MTALAQSIQDLIDLLLRNRRFLGMTVLAIGMGLMGLPEHSCDRCVTIAQFCIAFGAYVTGAGMHVPDRLVAQKQKFENSGRVNLRDL